MCNTKYAHIATRHWTMEKDAVAEKKQKRR